MGSSELFLFEVDKLITRIDFDTAQFFWLSRKDCQIGLGNISTDMFIDICLLSGCSILPTFPPLENPTLYSNPVTIRDTCSMLLTLGRSVTAVCTHYQDEPQVQQMNYLDRYRRARLAVKHHVVIGEDGRIEPLDVEHAPSDVHEFMGQRLPEELYFYLSRGVIGPRVLNWLASGELYEYPPLEEGESGDYQNFVRTQLDAYRLPALALLSQPIYRFFQRKDVVMRFWFSKDVEKTLSHKDVVPSPRDLIASWNVREKMFRDRAGKIHVSVINHHHDKNNPSSMISLIM